MSVTIIIIRLFKVYKLIFQNTGLWEHIWKNIESLLPQVNSDFRDSRINQQMVPDTIRSSPRWQPWALPCRQLQLKADMPEEQGGKGPSGGVEGPVPSPAGTTFFWLHTQTIPLCIIYSETKQTLTSPHSQRVENSGWRQGRHVRPRHTGSYCRWPRPLLLSSWTWAHTCSTCWCVDRNTPPTSDMSCHLARLQHTV